MPTENEPREGDEHFVTATETFINQDVKSDERRADYEIALLATLQDQTLDIRPRDFADTAIEPNDRPRFFNASPKAVSIRTRLSPRTTRRAHARGFKIVFAHGMTLVGSREDLAQRVEIPQVASAANGVVINDILKRISGR